MKKLLYLVLPLILFLIVTSCNDDNKIQLSYNDDEVAVYVGETINVKPIVTGDDYTLEYTLSNDNASVDDEGNLTAVSVGQLTVTVTVKENDDVEVQLKVIIKEKTHYTITYDLVGGIWGTEEGVTEFEENQAVTLPKPTKEGYTFLGWYEGEQLVETITNKNYTLVAKWESDTLYTITYDTNGGVLPNDVVTTFKEDETVTLPTPTKEGYLFLGWYEGEQLVETITNKNYTLVAKWGQSSNETYTITYDVVGGVLPNNAVTTFKEDETVTLPIPTKEGYLFLGWYEGEQLVETITNKNYTLVAKWEPSSPKTYTITLDATGGVLPTGSTIVFKEGETVALPTPTKEGYIFLGWYEGNQFVNTITNKDYTLVAEWYKLSNVKTYTITLDVAGGVLSTSSTIVFKEGEAVALPTPTKEGYIFLGWYESGQLVETVTNKNYKLVAKWEQVSDASEIKVNYVLGSDVYLSNYKTRNDLINDLIVDIQTIKGDTYTLSYFNSYTGTGYGLFASTEGDKTFFADTQMREKWSWLLEYAKGLRNSSGYDTTQYDSLIKNGYVEADAATINLEMIGFICGKECTYTSGNVSYKSSDYSLAANNNGFWKINHNTLVSNNTYPKGTLASSALPYAVKSGSIFAGWYTSSDFNASSKINDNTVLSSSITVYPKFTTSGGSSSSNSSSITFDYNGGVTEALYLKYGTKLSTLIVNSYNGNFWSGTNYESNIYISNSGSDPKAQFSTRIYIAKDDYTGLYKVVSILKSGAYSSWPTNADYVITISGKYNGAYDDNFTLSKISLDDVVIFDKSIGSISSSAPANVYFYSENLTKDEIVETVSSDFVMPSPKRVGYKFMGWYDEADNKYETASDFEGVNNITVYAKWKYEDHIIGSFESDSWVVVNKSIQLEAKYASGNAGTLNWVSKTPNVATVDINGVVTGVAEGLATIVVSDANYPDISFTYYVTVFAETPTGILKLLVDSNNESIFTREDLIIGISGESGTYYTDVVGSVSKLLFEDYEVYDDYYLSSPTNKRALSSNGIEFITFHYAADMKGSSTNGGKNLASYNQTCNNNGIQASWHYGVGNDGIWACQTESYGAWHAGSSKAMTWHDTGIAYKSSDPEFAKITLGSDGYFYLNGQKTIVKNTTSGTKLNKMGLAFKVENGKYYISGCYNNSDYNYISSTGGNNNSIGIESSCAKGSDLWLTWQYSAQLCAKLLIKYNLPLTRLVGHHFFAGKWCPQPMLEHNLEIWWEFVELVRQEMSYYKNYSSYDLSFSSSSAYLDDNGRVNNLPTYTECVTYTITYKTGSTTKTVTLSSILPGKVA